MRRSINGHASIIEAATKAGGLALYFFADNDNRDQSAPIHFHGASLRTISTGPQSREKRLLRVPTGPASSV